MNDTETGPDFAVTAVRGREQILQFVPKLQQLAAACGQPGTMHGLNLLLESQFSSRKHPCLICFNPSVGSTSTVRVTELAGAVLLLEYRFFGIPTAVFATGDAFGVRTVVGPAHLHALFCLRAGQFLLHKGARLVLTTWRMSPAPGVVRRQAFPAKEDFLYAAVQRTVQDSLLLAASAEETLQRLGKRTRVHLRADRRRFDREYPNAQLEDATGLLATADDATLQGLNQQSLDVIDQNDFNHQVRSLCRHEGGFALGLRVGEKWIALIGGWRQQNATWIEWQCNGRGFEKFSLGSVLRTYLLEEEVRRGTTQLSFHGGTSHSMLHRFQRTAVADLLMRRPGPLTGLLVRMAPWLCARSPALLRRGNFVFDALCTPGLRWSEVPPVDRSEPETDAPDC